MSWLDQFAGELARRGIGGRDRHRILDELRDHIACEPASVDRLGDPHALAATFADELATSRTRRAALWAFGALAAAAFVLALSQVTISRAGGYPGFDHGVSQFLFWPALLGVTIAPQAALVAGTLAAWRAVQRRRTPTLPEAELALIARRARVALACGLATMAGLEFYVINFVAQFPLWYEVVVAGLAALAAAGLAMAWRIVGFARTVRSNAAGPAGDMFVDLPIIGWAWLRRRPWLVGALASLVAAAVMTAGAGSAEHSLVGPAARSGRGRRRGRGLPPPRAGHRSRRGRARRARRRGVDVRSSGCRPRDRHPDDESDLVPRHQAQEPVTR